MNIGGGGGEGGGGGSGGGLAMRSSSPFTWSQYQELEQQAMIFKYMMAGVPVPPDLVLPIHKSFESISHRFFQHPAMGYCSFYGKAADPEPGRCRRTDGKKWRCAKEAYPDSKYCERHMHRGRNRSRKPVESHTTMQSLSTVTSLTVSGSSSGSGSFQSIPLHAFGSPQGSVSGTNLSHYTLDSIPYGIPSKDYSCQSRYAQGPKPEGGDRSFFSEPSGSNKGMSIDAQLDNAWSLMHSKVTSYPSKSTDNAMLQRDYTQQHSFYGTEYASSTTKSKQDGQSILPFFDEWPKTREAWSGLEDDTSNQTSYSTTQLSISMPVPPADYSTTSSHSPQDK